jgi:hypothetical protein
VKLKIAVYVQLSVQPTRLTATGRSICFNLGFFFEQCGYMRQGHNEEYMFESEDEELINAKRTDTEEFSAYWGWILEAHRP